MNIHYTGRQVDLSAAQRKKVEAKFQKIQKILGRRHEPEAHVILSLERHLHIAEVTVNFQHHTMVVECSGPDLLAAMQEAVDKLEKQIIRNKDKWREKKRRTRTGWEQMAEEPPASPRQTNGGATFRRGAFRTRLPARLTTGAGGPPRIFRTTTPAAKPLTVEEAVLEMEQDDRDCVVYQDAEKGHLSVLFRRRDGHLELVEA